VWPFLAGAFMNWLEGRFRHASDREPGPLEELAHLEG
jgi:hypothetical protein